MNQTNENARLAPGAVVTTLNTGNLTSIRSAAQPSTHRRGGTTNRIITVDEAVRTACDQAGIVYRGVPADGCWHRADIEDDRKGKGDGSIKLFRDGNGGIVNNWKGVLLTFFASDGLVLSKDQQRERNKQRADAMREAKADDTRRHAEAAKKAAAIWRNAPCSLGKHAYLVKKRIQAYGTRLHNGALVIPVWIGDKLCSLQYIDAAGGKLFLTDGRIKGGSYIIGDTRGAAALCIAEGFATGATIYEATGYPVAVAFNAGNLEPVARAMSEKFPDLVLAVCADDDVATDGNPGLTKAKEAAQAVGALLVIPAFGSNRPEGVTDFNDMSAHRGQDTVKLAITGVIESHKGRSTPDTAHGPESPNTDGALSNTDVMDVTPVRASNGTGFGVTSAGAGDVTDVSDEGEPVIPDADERPRFKVFNDWQPLPDGRKLKPGVWFFSMKAGKGDEPPTLTQQWICSPLHVEAVTSDGQENNFGRLLRFKNTHDRERKWAMPMELLRGAGDDLRGELLSMGVLIDPQEKTLLGRYLQWGTPKRKMQCALQVGWCANGSFVLPDTVIGPAASGVIFQSGERGNNEHTLGGTMAGWQAGIAARATGNPLLLLALSASFAGPMLAKCNGESGGIHFVGNSSTGKTTAIEAACATWGGPSYRRSWRTTSNGLEGAAALFNDCLLALDEISECDPKDVGAIVYALANGHGKQRANRTGTAKGVTRWRVWVLSNGERTISTTMAEGGFRAKAGQSVRMLDIPAERRFGAWDELHGLPNGAAFSDAIRLAAVTHHGHAGRAFLEKLTRDTRDFGAYLEQVKALPQFAAEGSEGQDKRTAGRFALLALAGELATEYGITDWPEGAAIEAATEGLKAWRSTRGRGNDERRGILEQVAGFIERHGDSRFSNADMNSPDDAIRNNRAGWYRDEHGGRVYLFTAEGMREAVTGFDFKRALDTLQEAGALPKADANGERARPQRFNGRVVKVYAIHAEKLGGDHGA